MGREVRLLPTSGGSHAAIPFPALVPDRQAFVVRAHRLRGAVVAGLIRDLARWVSAASR